jgi:hypothetical protein
MNENNKAPNSNLLTSDNNINLKIPQHIYKLYTKLVLLQDKSCIEGTLKQFSHLIKYDEILKNIFYFFGWDDQLKSFTKPVNYDNLTAKIEKEYEFSLSYHSNLDEKSNEERVVGKKHLNLEPENDPFFVKKPIALSNQLDRKTEGYQLNPISEQFLTNSAKMMYNNERVGYLITLG